MTDGLFPEPEPTLFRRGLRVRVQTMWGEERAVITDVFRVRGYPMIECLMPTGDRVAMNCARVTLLDVSDEDDS